MAKSKVSNHDIEQATAFEPLLNSAISQLSWHDVTVTVTDRTTKQSRNLLRNISGEAKAGEVVALLGPSGSGKTTLLNTLARRNTTSSGNVSGLVLTDGAQLSEKAYRQATSYVEQEDTLIGSLTVRETVDFSARLSFPRTVTKRERLSRVDSLLQAFGLAEQADTLIGTPLRKGVSGGQKRRASVASQIISNPKILFLDEPTSGLDSVASFEIVSHLRKVAKQYNLIIVASIHQPSTTTFNLFDKLLLLSQGRTCYYGSLEDVGPYFASIGCPIPSHTNPAEHLLEMTNIDFKASNDNDAQQQLDAIHTQWDQRGLTITAREKRDGPSSRGESLQGPNKLSITRTLLHRLFIKSYRDVVAYGIRIAMYMGLAIMMGTVWLRLSTTQESIQPFINAIFFGSAFMSFMAVAYVPAYLEDRATFAKDRANGLYGALPFLIANFIIGLPYLFLISVLFSVVAYWLSNMQPTGTAFMTWIMWLFLDLLAAESLVVLVSSVFPIFVVALAIVAFANGLWMSVGGFLVSPTVLNVFWRYVFHYIDYQTYVFQGMMVNEFQDRTYTCGEGCHCMYQTELADQCLIKGTGVLDSYGYATGRTGKWVGIMIGIIAVYRVLCFLALHYKK
ncbi:MAG: hypothetical protein M1828_000668 [Chrysothrix sp. TS-e1954]|nr:MAG: hypothetical protein M1828_000668 [Chrysothrix sp. TS-e1954]